MKKILLAMVFLYTAIFPADVDLIGPRAGIGFLSDNKGTSLDEGVHSGFGWQIEIPYKSNDFTGYGEGGFLLLGVEQGKFYPTAWGFFGMRYKFVGIGAGPVINPMGVGIGFGPYFQINLEKIRIPIGVNIEIIKQNPRYQMLVGFSLN